MSFFDDDDEPIRVTRTRPAAPRTAGARAGGGGGRGGAGAVDDATLQRRRIAALAIGIFVVIVLVLVVHSCSTSATQNALRDYNRSVSDLVTDSKRSVGEPLFQALEGGGDPQDLQVQVNQLRVTAEDQARRAKGLDVPDQVARAQDDLELVMNLRTSAIADVGRQLPSATATGRDAAVTAEAAVTRIAGDMQSVLASDVVYSQRVAPYIRDALSDADVSGQRIAGNEVRFLTNFGWLVPDQVAGRFNTPRTGGGTGASAEPAPGLHGHGLTSVSVGSTTLQPGGAINQVPASGSVAFAVSFQNQGDNDETDVPVSVRVTRAGQTPITVQRQVPSTTAGDTAQVTVPLGRTPPTGTATVRVSVGRVPGEENVENNTQTYTVVFGS